MVFSSTIPAVSSMERLNADLNRWSSFSYGDSDTTINKLPAFAFIPQSYIDFTGKKSFGICFTIFLYVHDKNNNNNKTKATGVSTVSSTHRWPIDWLELHEE